MNSLAIKEKIIPVYIEDEMKRSYLSYSMSVIVGRACRMSATGSNRCIAVFFTR